MEAPIPALPEDVEALARRAAATPDALVALRAVCTLRDKLGDLERRHVISAVDAGASWAQVAAALGVTKQAAHRRHSKAVREAASAPAPAERKILVTSESRAAVRNARDEARALGHPLVGTEHLLLGILRCERSPAALALRDAGMELEAARMAVQPTLVEADPDVDGPATSSNGGPPDDERHGMTAHARDVLERSLQEALARSEGYIGVEHLLLALLRDEAGGAARTLTALEVDLSGLRRSLQASW